jgi:EipB-like
MTFLRMNRLALAAILSLAGTAIGAPALAQPAKDTALASHVAIYDLRLASTRGKRALESVRGRIVYDFSGSPCEGYVLSFRQVSALDTGEGKMVMSDLRSNTWEDGEGKSFRFNSENFMDQKLSDNSDGSAERGSNGVVVKLAKPRNKQLELGEVAFPTTHMRKIIAAARAGQRLFETQVFDGSESGEKVYQSLAVIGQMIPPEKQPTDATAGKVELSKLARWPVTISYFDKGGKEGEQTPVYAITFEMYENGISRALRLDYGDFVVDGTMTSLELRDSKPCQ